MGDKPGSRLFFFHITATFTARDSGSIGSCVVMHTRPPLYGLLCDFCLSVREFARWHPASFRLRLSMDTLAFG